MVQIPKAESEDWVLGDGTAPATGSGDRCKLPWMGAGWSAGRYMVVLYILGPPVDLSWHLRSCFYVCWGLCTFFWGITNLDSWRGVVSKLKGCRGILGVGSVPDLQSGGCGLESQPGLLRTKVYSAFHPSGVGKWVTAAAGKAKAGTAHSNRGWTCGRAGKSVKSLENTCRTWALLRWWFTTKRRYIKCMHLYLYLYL